MTLADTPRAVAPAGPGPAETAPAPTKTGGPAPRAPELAEGVELIGEYEGSGYKDAPSLVRRPDGQVLQLPPLLYSLAAKADGTRSLEELASQVGAEIHRGIDADQVQFLVEEKLRPLGVLAAADGTSPRSEKRDPFLGLRFRASVISERTSNMLGTIFKPLFLAPMVVAVIAAFVAADAWLFLGHGVAQALRQSIDHPGLFLPLFAAVILSAAFHEIGHAAACGYGGGHPGKMGCGLYLAFPAFYTDVTDAYRLGKKGRLRTDLGGVYFNIVVVLATVGAYLATHFEPLLLLILIEHFEIAHQLLPVIRLDGYYIVADLTGVPDLFARIGPILSSLAPWRKADERVTLLKRWVRVAVTAWVLVVVPLLVFELLIVLIHLPRILATGWSSGSKLWHDAGHAFTHGNALGGTTDALQIIVLVLPIAGIVLMLVSTAKRGATWVWHHTQGRPALRLLSAAAAGAALTLLGFAWLPTHNYKPIQPGERGTLAEGVNAVRRLPSGSGPLFSQQQAQKRATTPTSPAPATPPPAAVASSTSSTTVPVIAPRTTVTTGRSSATTALGGGASGTTTATPRTTTTPRTTVTTVTSAP